MTRYYLPVLISIFSISCNNCLNLRPPPVKGTDGNLAFSYYSERSNKKGMLSFGYPLAEGMEIGVRTHASTNLNSPPLELSDIDVKNPEILSLRIIEEENMPDRFFIMKGLSEGITEVHVSSGELEDRFNVEVRKLNKVELTYNNTSVSLFDIQPPLKVLKDSVLEFNVLMLDENENSIVGYANSELIHFIPENAARWKSGKRVRTIEFSFDTLGEMELISKSSDPIHITTVDVEHVEDLSFAGIDGKELGETLVFDVFALDGEGNIVLGARELIWVVSLVPEICEVQIHDAYSLNLFGYTLQVHETGECLIQGQFYNTLEVEKSIGVVYQPQGQ